MSSLLPLMPARLPKVLRPRAAVSALILACLVACFASPAVCAPVEQPSDAATPLLSGRLSFTLDGLGLPLDGQWSIATGPDDQGGKALILTLSDWEAANPSFRGRIDASIVLSTSPEGFIPTRVTLSSDDILLVESGVHHALSFTSLVAQDREANRYTLRELELVLGDILLVTGSALFAPDDAIPLKSATLQGGASDLSQLLDLLNALGVEVLGDTVLDGAVGIELEAVEEGRGLSVTALLAPDNLSVDIAGTPHVEKLSGQARLLVPVVLFDNGRPGFGEWRLDADLELIRVGAPQGSERLDVSLNMDGPDQRAEQFPFPLHLNRLSIAPHGQLPELKGLMATASILPTSGGGLTSSDLMLTVAEAGEFPGAFWLPGGEDDPVPPALAEPDDTPSEEEANEQQYLRLKGEAVNLDKLASFLTDMLGLDLTQYAPRGRAEVEFTMETRDDGPLLATCDIQVAGGGFATSDGMTLGDKLSFRIGVEYSLEDSPQLILSSGVSSGEMLLGGVTYINYANTALGMTLVGTPRFGNVFSLPSMRLIVGLKHHGRAVFTGSASFADNGPSLTGDLAVTNADLASLFATFLRDQLSINSPGLADMVIEGQASLDCHLEHTPSGTLVRGRAAIEDGALGLGDEGRDVVLTELGLTLPFDYDFRDSAGTSDSPPPPASWGRLEAEDALLPTGSMSRISVPLVISGNTLFTGTDLLVPVLNGMLVLSDLTVANPLSEDYSIDAVARLETIDFAALDTSVPLEGGIGGPLGRIHLDSKRLDVEKDLAGTFFGGDLFVENMAVERPMAADRRIKADISATRMHFDSISEALGIGTISGRLNVTIDDLVMAYGQPAAFRLIARSEEVDGVDQDISLKAVNSIAVMGNGSGITDMGIGVFASFFETFAYDEIGIACDLEQDVFRVRGLLHEGDVEYFITKPLFAGINVVNVYPDNRISFKDMLERVKRVVQPDDGKGPIIE